MKLKDFKSPNLVYTVVYYPRRNCEKSDWFSIHVHKVIAIQGKYAQVVSASDEWDIPTAYYLRSKNDNHLTMKNTAGVVLFRTKQEADEYIRKALADLDSFNKMIKKQEMEDARCDLKKHMKQWGYK